MNIIGFEHMVVMSDFIVFKQFRPANNSKNLVTLNMMTESQIELEIEFAKKFSKSILL